MEVVVTLQKFKLKRNLKSNPRGKADGLQTVLLTVTSLSHKGAWGWERSLFRSTKGALSTEDSTGGRRRMQFQTPRSRVRDPQPALQGQLRAAPGETSEAGRRLPGTQLDTGTDLLGPGRLGGSLPGKMERGQGGGESGKEEAVYHICFKTASLIRNALLCVPLNGIDFRDGACIGGPT